MSEMVSPDPSNILILLQTARSPTQQISADVCLGASKGLSTILTPAPERDPAPLPGLQGASDSLKTPIWSHCSNSAKPVPALR